MRGVRSAVAYSRVGVDTQVRDQWRQRCGGQGQVVSNGGDAGGIDLRMGGEVLSAAHGVGHDAPVDVGGGVVDAVGELPRESGGVGLVGQPLSPHADGEGEVFLALAVGLPLGYEVGHAAVAGQVGNALERGRRRWGC